MLKCLADHCFHSTIQRHMLFLVVTLLSIAFIGYHFGTLDQASHIPFLKKYADPSLFPGDKFFDIRYQMFSYFWFFFLPFYKPGLLEATMFIVHVLTTYLTFWSIWSLSDTLFQNHLASLLAVIAFIFPHVGFAGFPAIEFSLLNRTFVLPFLLWAITLFLKRHYLLAFMVLGLMYNLHVVSVNFVLAMFLLDGVLEFRKVGWRNLLFGMILFMVCALPVLIWKLGVSHVDWTLRPDWFSIIARGALYSIFFFIAPYPHILFATLSGVSTLVLFFIAYRRKPAPRYDHTIAVFVYAVLIILVTQIIATHWLPITIIIQSQITRAGFFALIFGYLYFTHYLAELYESRLQGQGDFGLLTASLVTALFSFVPVIVWAIQRLIVSIRWRQVVISSILIITFVGSVVFAVQYNLWYPGIYIFAHKTSWYDAQIWARDNTPKDTMFITPPQIWWLYEPEWRVFSERSTVVSLSELDVGAFMPDYMSIWKPRFEALAPGALARFKGNYFENTDITAQAFYSLSSDNLLSIARQYKASYLVVEKPHLHDWQIVYENDRFVIYKLPSEK